MSLLLVRVCRESAMMLLTAGACCAGLAEASDLSPPVYG